MAAARRRHPRRPGDDLLKRIAVVWLVGAALVAAVAGCGGENKEAATPPGPTKTTAVRVYFLRDGKVQPVRREVDAAVTNGDAAPLADAALRALVAGPSQSERQLGLTSSVPSDLEWGQAVTAADGKIAVEIEHDISRPALAQVVYTLAQFSQPPRPPRVSISEGSPIYAPSDFEDETPIILVESPLPFQKVTSPLHATGTANTFEATFQYDLVGPDGKLIKTHFVTATSGSGTRGTFDFTVPFTVAHAGTGKLVVYERSAENGKRIHQVEIPIQLTE